jgi:cytochrome c-type biogenesis protein
MTSGWVDYLTGPWGPAFAFAAGLLSFLSPCVLPLVPAYLAHMTGTAATSDTPGNRRETVTHAVLFVLGFTLVFTFFAASVGLIKVFASADDSFAIKDQEHLIAKIGGVLLIIMGLNLAGVIRIPLLYRTYNLESVTGPAPALATATAVAGGGSGGGAPSMPGGGFASGLRYASSFGVGAVFAVGWTPCIGPVLGAITGLVAESDSVGRGIYLMLVYSLGLGVPFVITGLAVVPVMTFLRRYSSWLPWVEIAMGVFVIIVGALIFLDDTSIFNEYFDFFGLSEI